MHVGRHHPCIRGYFLVNLIFIEHGKYDISYKFSYFCTTRINSFEDVGGRELNALSNKVQEPYRRGGDLAAEGGGI